VRERAEYKTLTKRQEEENGEMRGRRKYESLKKAKWNTRRRKGEGTTNGEKRQKEKKTKKKRIIWR
jgi:hypothetical protein